MKLVLDAQFPFVDSNQNSAHYHLKLYEQEEGATPQAIVVATEVADNPGMSVTNTYETLATFATQVLGLEPAQTLWVEHYNAESYAGKPMEHETEDRYSLVQMSWNGQRFSTPWFIHLSASQLQGLIGCQEQTQPFDPALLTLDRVNQVAARYGLQVLSAQSEKLRYEPTLRLAGKAYVVVDTDGTVLSPHKDLDSASMFLTLWSMTHAPIETAEDKATEAIELERLNAIAKPKGLKVIKSGTPGYQHHDWVVKYKCPYAVVNEYGTVVTTARDLATAEAVVLLQADQDKDPLEL